MSDRDEDMMLRNTHPHVPRRGSLEPSLEQDREDIPEAAENCCTSWSKKLFRVMREYHKFGKVLCHRTYGGGSDLAGAQVWGQGLPC